MSELQARENSTSLSPSRDEIKDAELIITAFRTLVVLTLVVAPLVLGIRPQYGPREIALLVLAGVYNIAMGLACLAPGRYGVRRPLVLAMDTMLVTMWIHLTGRWELFPFYYVIVVVAAMWYLVPGGVAAAAICDFLYLLLWGRIAADENLMHPPVFTAAMAINTALLFMVGALAGYISEAQEREREEKLERELLITNYQREFDVAAQLQPLLVSRLEETDPYLELGAALQSARIVGGGDYLDALPLSNGATLLCIADVAGKSVRAQARVPLLKYSLRALAPFHAKPDELAARLQEVLAPDLGPEIYIALCLIALDAQHEKLTWCNAGHIAPLLVREDRTFPLETTCPALGLFPDLPLSAKTMAWKPNDALLLFTDGLADAFSFGGSEDGEAQIKLLAAKLAAHDAPAAPEAAQELVDLAGAIWDDKAPIKRYFSLPARGSAQAVQRDDVAVLVARHRNLRAGT